MIVSVPMARIKPEGRGAPYETSATPTTMTVRVPFQVRMRGARVKIVAPDGQEAEPLAPPKADSAMVKALARGFRWRKLI